MIKEDRFRDMDRDERKQVLCQLHELRRAMEARGEEMSEFLGQLRHLEDVHADLVKKRGYLL